MNRICIRILQMGFVFMILSACVDSSRMILSDFVSMDEQGLKPSYIYMFPNSNADSLCYPDSECSVIIVVRCDNSTELETIPLRIIEYNGLNLDADTINISLDLQKGATPLATGGYGLREVCDTIRTGVILPYGYSVGVVSGFDGYVSSVRTMGIVVTKTQ